MRILLIAAVVVAAFGLSACGSDKAPAEKEPVDVEDQLGFDQAGILARQSRVEAVIRNCMRAQGFEYTPIDPYAQRAKILGSARITDNEFLRQFGYGISTLWGRGRNVANPNDRYRLSLAKSDRRAYDAALWGDNVGTTFQEAVDSGDFTKLGGCTRKATAKVFGGAQVLTELQGKLDELEERVLQDQRMVRAIAAWSKCMSKAGFSYEEPESIDTDLFKRMERIVGPLPGQFATGPAPGEKPQPYNKRALARLQSD